MNRREMLLSAALAPPGLTVRMQEPPNLESSFADLESERTPTPQFFVRSHFATPKIDAESYRLSVEGHVAKPLTFTLAELKAMPATTAPLTLECAGNGRVFLTPAPRGLMWQLGAVGNAEWTGIPLAALLERAGVKPGAVEVILVGADRGAITSDPPSPGPIAFDRSLPLEKALKPEVRLAWAMNGEALAPAHGFPLRAVVGGWYGVASVKWLTRIVVADKPYDGFWQSLDYSYFTRRDGGLPSLTPVTVMQPKAQIARPQLGELVAAGKPYTVRGAAWAGEVAVARVDVSIDGGTTWAAAKLLGEAVPFCWRLWEHTWTPAVGPAKLLARCTDAKGQAQPEKRDADRRSYMINHLVPVEVTAS